VNIATLIGIAISIVIGVALVPTVVGTVNSLDTVATPSAVLNLANLLPIVFVAILIIGAVEKKLAAIVSNDNMKTGQIRGSLNPIGQLDIGNPELNLRDSLSKCVETRGSGPHAGHGIVRSLPKGRTNSGFIAYAVTG